MTQSITLLDREHIFLLYALSESARALENLSEITRLAALRTTRTSTVEVRENQSVFDTLRLALQSSANISKVFWPPSTRSPAKERGERLRRMTGMDETHALKLRTLRNHIEHLDERLDAWTTVSPRPFISIEHTINVDVQSWPNLQDIIDSTAVVYMESDNSVHLLGEKFFLNDLRDNVLDVQNRVSQALNPSKIS